MISDQKSIGRLISKIDIARHWLKNRAHKNANCNTYWCKVFCENVRSKMKNKINGRTWLGMILKRRNMTKLRSNEIMNKLEPVPVPELGLLPYCRFDTVTNILKYWTCLRWKTNVAEDAWTIISFTSTTYACTRVRWA